MQDAVVEGLFVAYFVEGRDVGDAKVLAKVAVAAGMDKTRVESFLASSEGAEEVSEAEIASQRSGLNGVPTFIINGQPAFSGARHAELMFAHLIKAAALS